MFGKGGRISKSGMTGTTIEYSITMPESRPLIITIVYVGKRDIDGATTTCLGDFVSLKNVNVYEESRYFPNTVRRHLKIYL